MGKTVRWFRSLLGGKKTAGDATKPPAKEKKRWGFVKSFRDRDRPAPMATAAASGQDDAATKKGTCREVPYSSFYGDESAVVDPNKHAIAVAAATAAVAEAAVAAAQAAAAVVKLTSSGRRTSAAYGGRRREEWAAVKIQAAFRGYLARRALRALKGLVKLQALVRGHIVRKQAAETMRCMQALVRVQARVRAGRLRASESRHVGIGSQSHLVPVTPEKHELLIHADSMKIDRPGTLKRNVSKPSSRDTMNHDKEHSSRKCLDHWMDERLSDHPETVIRPGGADDENDKILEVDMGKPSLNAKRRNTNHHNSQSSTRNSQSFGALPDSPSKDSATAQLSAPSPSSVEVQSLTPLRYTIEVDELSVFDTAENSPQFYSASSRPGSSHRGAFTPTKSECSRSFFSSYSDYPNYMSNTESWRAKVRSQSAPKQRPEFEKSSSMKKFSLHGFADARVQVQSAQRSSSSLQARFASKAYPGSGRLDRLGMPIREVVAHGSINRSKW